MTYFDKYKGRKVHIYQDLSDRRIDSPNYEGIAVITSVSGGGLDGLLHRQVRFDGERETYGRLVNPKDIITEGK